MERRTAVQASGEGRISPSASRRYMLRGGLVGLLLAAWIVTVSWRAIATGRASYSEVAFGTGQLTILLGLPAYFVVAPVAALVMPLYTDRVETVWPEFVAITLVLLGLNGAFWGWAIGAAKDWLSRPAT